MTQPHSTCAIAQSNRQTWLRLAAMILSVRPIEAISQTRSMYFSVLLWSDGGAHLLMMSHTRSIWSLRIRVRRFTIAARMPSSSVLNCSNFPSVFGVILPCQADEDILRLRGLLFRSPRGSFEDLASIPLIVKT